jgi:hypothetical protein
MPNPKLFVYRIVTDAGTAPHISNNYLTLTLCKPGIRKSAKVGDYVLALVALQHTDLTGKAEDRFYKAAYLFCITEHVSMQGYEGWCRTHAPSKICSENIFDGNCQYNISGAHRPGPHNITHKNKDLSGKFSLISNHYAAWTSYKPHTLSDSELDNIALSKQQIQTATRNYFTVSLDNPAQIAALEKLIREAVPAPAQACKGKTCKGGATRKQRKTRKNEFYYS